MQTSAFDPKLTSWRAISTVPDFAGADGETRTLTGNLPRDFKFSSWGWVAKRLQHATIGSSMTETGRQVAVVVYVVVMVAIIVGVDFAFFRNHFWERLVLVFAAFYWRFLSRN